MTNPPPVPAASSADGPDAAFLAIWLPRLHQRWRSGTLTAAAYAAAYFVVWRIARHGSCFAARRSKRDPRPDAGTWLAHLESPGVQVHEQLCVWLETAQFRGVAGAVVEALSAWLRGAYDLQLRLEIPDPLEVLRLQAQGSRPVTLIPDPDRALRPVLSKADGDAFLIHDLEHAFRFFHDPRLHAGQRRWFGYLLRAVEAGLFESLRADPVFAGQFDYLISDMNTHPLHGLRYLTAVLIEAQLRREGRAVTAPLSAAGEARLQALLEMLADCWQFPAAAREAFLTLLRPGFAVAAAFALGAALGVPPGSAGDRGREWSTRMPVAAIPPGGFRDGS